MKLFLSLFSVALLTTVMVPARAAEPEGRIAAAPNPCAIPAGKTTCTSHISWETRNVRKAQVFVVTEGRNGRQEHNFGDTISCAGVRCRAPWIEKGRNYEFTLYDYSTGARGKSLGSVIVTGQ